MYDHATSEMGAVKLAKDVFELVIVTYNKDFDRAIALIKSLRSEIWFGGDLCIHLVVNDVAAIYDAVKSAVSDIKSVSVYLGQQLGIGHLQGWRSQQWIKLVMSKHITTDWYMVIDSDQVIWNNVKVDLPDWFCGHKAQYKNKTINDFVGNPWFARYYQNAADFWGIENFDQYHHKLLSETPPVMFHTATVKDMLQHCDAKLITRDNTHEAGLYWCYLIKQQLIDQLYVPFDSINHCNQLMEIRIQ